MNEKYTPISPCSNVVMSSNAEKSILPSLRITTSPLGNIPPTRKCWIDILLKEDPNLLGQEYPNQQWLPLSQLQNPIRRSLCSNEFVFDIDAKDWTSCYRLAKNLEDVFKKFNIPFFRFTSGNWLHYHVWFDKDVGCPNEILRDYFLTIEKIMISMNDILEFLKKLRFEIFRFIVSRVKPVDGASFDLGLMKAERHLIRMEGTMNEKTGYYKSLLFELPKEKPKIKMEEVILPEKLTYWFIPEELIYYVYYNCIRPEAKRKGIKELEAKRRGTEYIKEKLTTKIIWIESILEKTFRDGRKRLIDLVVLPYLINIRGLSENEAIKICYEWALKCHRIEAIRIKSRILDEQGLLNYIEMKARYVASKGLKPLRKENVVTWFQDCEEILKVVV